MVEKLRIITIISILTLSGTFSVKAQYASTKVRPKHQQYTDSLKAHTYERILPIWGQERIKKALIFRTH